MPQGAQRIVVTGGAGFIGSHLVDRLLLEGHDKVIVFDNLSRGRVSNISHHCSNPRFELVEGDVRDPRATSDVFAGVSLVYHLAAQPSVLGAVEDATYTFTTNVVGTFNVLRAATQH